MYESDRQFRSAFAVDPTHVAEAPGRVNLIGDHTDYNDLPVLPVALAERVRIRLRPRADDRLRIHTTLVPDSPASLSLADDLLPHPPGDWRNYVRAAAAGVRECLPPEARGFDGVVLSDLPVASGLSSSSALVVAVMVALLGVNEVETDFLATATLAARAERYVGTAGGGMDQAAAMCGRAGHALRIDFAPLRVRPVPVPDQWSFIVAFSGETAEKSGSVQRRYNARVASCRAALDVVGEAIGMDRALSYPALLSTVPLVELLTLADEVLEGSQLRYFRHTVTEADRVERAVQALLDDDATGFGALMRHSHASLRDDYGVSTPTLNGLVRAATDAGSFGARLTGAGFGGSVVALCAQDRAADVVDGMTSALPPPTSAAVASGKGRVFQITPAGGAGFSQVV